MSEEKTTTEEKTEDNKVNDKVREGGLGQKIVKATDDSKKAVDEKEAEAILEVVKDESGL